MSDSIVLRPTLRVLCGVGEGTGKQKQVLIVLILDDGKILRAERQDADGVLEAAPARYVSLHGDRCILAPCPKHGLMYVREADVRSLFAKTLRRRNARRTLITRSRLPGTSSWRVVDSQKAQS